MDNRNADPRRELAAGARIALAVVAAAALLRSDARAPRRLVRGEFSGPLGLAPVRLDLPDGEKLTYTVGWSAGETGVFMPAGKGTLEVRRRPGGLFELSMRASSNRFVDAFYRLRDEATSLVDAEGGRSFIFEIDKDERGRRSYERAVFDYSSLVARSVERRRNGRLKRSRATLDGPVLDALSCLYYIRAAGVEAGRQFRLPVFQNGKLWELKVELGEPEELELPELGRFRACRAGPEASFPGLFERKGELAVWFEERTGIALKALARLPVGSAELRLVGAENSPLLRAE